MPINITSQEIENAIQASARFQVLMNRLLPILLSGIENFSEITRNPDDYVAKKEATHFLNGTLIIHMFSIWDTHLGNDYIRKYFREEEKKRFYAFKHIRIVAAHNIDGNRKGNRTNQDRMDHADKLDEIMQSDRPIDGILHDHYTLDLGLSNAALQCRQFLQDMATRLPVRISSGGAEGQIRNASGGTEPAQ